MLSAQGQSIRLLQTVLVAAVAVPAVLFCFASWQGYKNNEKVADDQIDRSRDVLNEHRPNRCPDVLRLAIGRNDIHSSEQLPEFLVAYIDAFVRKHSH